MSTMSTIVIHDLRFEDLHDFWITLIEQYDLGLDDRISLLMTCRNIHNFVKLSRYRLFVESTVTPEYFKHTLKIFPNIVSIRYSYDFANILTEELVLNVAEKCINLEECFLMNSYKPLVTPCGKLSDDAANAVINNCKNLKKITLAKFSMTALMIHIFSESNVLTHISLSNCYKLSDSAVKYLSKSSSLQSIKLTFMHITDNTVLYFSQLASLQSIELFSNSMTDVSALYLSESSSLQSVVLLSNSMTDNAALYLSKSTSLQCVTLINLIITNDAALYLSKSTTIKNMEIRCSLSSQHRNITDSFTYNLSKSQTLQKLVLANFDTLTDLSVFNLAACENLRCVIFKTCVKFTPQMTIHFPHYKILEEIHIWECNIAPSSYSILSQCKHLKKISIDACNKINDDIANHLIKCENLEFVKLGKCPITHITLDILNKKKSIKRINVISCKNITFEMMKASRKCVLPNPT